MNIWVPISSFFVYPQCSLYSIKIPSFLHCLSVPYFHPICIHISALGMKTKPDAVLRFPTVQLPPPPNTSSLYRSTIHTLLCLHATFLYPTSTVKRFPLPLAVDVATDFISRIKPLYLLCILITIILLQRAAGMWSAWQGIQDPIDPKQGASFMAIERFLLPLHCSWSWLW
jgi:hypothetical protein